MSKQSNSANLELCAITLKNKQAFMVRVHYRNAITPLVDEPVIYFETGSDEVPTVSHTELYHVWKCNDGSALTAWYVPESQIKSIEFI
jgi:hypothetical protein